MLNLTLYLRDNCSLCEAMEAELVPYVEEYSIIIQRRFIDNEPKLQQQYGEKIPVLTLNHNIVCFYFLDMEKLLNIIKNR